MGALPGFNPRRFFIAFIFQAVMLAAAYSLIRHNIIRIDVTLILALFILLVAILTVSVAFALKPAAERMRKIESLETKLGEDREILARQESQWQELLSYLRLGVVLVDGNGNVLLSNPAMQRLFALSPEEAKASSLAHFIRHYQFVELWRTARREKITQTLSAEVPQSKRFLRAEAYPLREPLQDLTLLVFEDVTELRHLETIRRDFVSNVSHELRTPLTSLKVLIESLRSGALEEPATASRFLGHIETEVDALTELVSELLELARIESQQFPLQRSPSDPCAVLKQGVERLRLQAERAGVTLTIECEEGLAHVLADAPRLEQVLVNLIHNAIKFTPSGGVITVAAKQGPGVIEFSVADTGAGISPDNQQRIFERFYKANPARNRVGTGLGLAIAKHIVEAHEGNIGVESKEGVGSRFFFTIPIAR